MASTSSPVSPVVETDSLAELLGDCRRMAPHWAVPAHAAPSAAAPSSLHGITVPLASAHVVDGMAEYGA
ncbi:hypothetical protein [Streptomyces sp. H39-S7]|uniref:hypothetical protein n=1 Tax=Streptomyces sp. H39-S7 TaxID=3004357 RepID=UPI0022AF3482|nr:hypothetical protein [Streptomyces sp. H39-S7]MCZ4121652.1 hypothetical protein [Streptomyces sp. H39-S7]